MLIIPGYRILKIEPPGTDKLVVLRCCQVAGGLQPDDVPVLYPGGRRLKIKSVKTIPGAVSLRIKGIPRAALKSGAMIIDAGWPVEESRYGLFFHDGESIPDAGEAIRGGLDQEFNRDRLIGRATFKRDGAFLLARFPSPYPMIPGMSCSILSKDGRPRSLTLLMPGQPSPDEIRRLNGTAKRRPNPHPPLPEVYSRILHVRGWVKVPAILEQQDEAAAYNTGGWWLTNSVGDTVRRHIAKTSSRPGGADGNLFKTKEWPLDMVLALAESMVDAQELTKRGDWFFPPGEPRLSPFHRSWLQRLIDSGEEGIRSGSLRKQADIDAMEALGRSGLALGGKELWLSETSVDSLSDKLLSGLKSGDEVNITMAKERLAGSRVLVIEVLGILESLGRLSTGDETQARVLR